MKNEQAAKLNSRVDDSHVQIYARICVVAALVCIGDLEGAHSEAMLTMAEDPVPQRIAHIALDANIRASLQGRLGVGA